MNAVWGTLEFSFRAVSLLFQGSFPRLRLMKPQAKTAPVLISATSTAMEGKDLREAFQNWDSDFLNMPPGEVNTLDVTGLFFFFLFFSETMWRFVLKPGNMRTTVEVCF